jgi:uncharacterized coiled-coil DUF342 family protein
MICSEQPIDLNAEDMADDCHEYQQQIIKLEAEIVELRDQISARDKILNDIASGIYELSAEVKRQVFACNLCNMCRSLIKHKIDELKLEKTNV